MNTSLQFSTVDEPPLPPMAESLEAAKESETEHHGQDDVDRYNSTSYDETTDIDAT